MTMTMVIGVFFFLFCAAFSKAEGVLYPYESETRQTKSLDGLWTFKISPEDDKIGFANGWYAHRLEETGDTMEMPVPSSFNDITTNATIRDFLGWAWYQTEFYAPQSWNKTADSIYIRFGGIHYLSKVWLNGNPVGGHEGGHLPFEVDVTDQISLGDKNRLTVAANNVLDRNTLPPASVSEQYTDRRKTTYRVFTMNCDYFNYGGINRPVKLVVKPKVHACNVHIDTGYEATKGNVDYEIGICGGKESRCLVRLLDGESMTVAKSEGCVGRLQFDNVQLWWPFMSNHSTYGYMYTLEVKVESHLGPDIYRLPIGIRTVAWTSTSLLVNNEAVYLHGVGMHEDSDIRGRGFDNVLMTRDVNLLKWLGVNSIRTSHYPYAEETLNRVDQLGILVILEAPACSLDNFSDNLLSLHRTYVKEMIDQHRNRPAVIMWSLGNEPMADLHTSSEYFRSLVNHAHSLDSSRPVTVITATHPDKNNVVEHLDVICINRYYGWYTTPGRLDLIVSQVLDEFYLWHSKYQKPFVMSEYGAGSLINYHTLPSSMWSEDYHVDFLLEHFKAFDIMRKDGYFIGEMVWNFADFNVQQEYNRPGKCSKGLFTRDRQPKAPSYIVKARYHSFMLKESESQCSRAHVGGREPQDHSPIQALNNSFRAPSGYQAAASMLLLYYGIIYFLL